MHLKHILTTSILALLSSSATAQSDPNLNTGNLGLRNTPQNMVSMPKTSGSATPSSSETSTSSSSMMTTSSMASNSSTSTMATMTPTPSSSSMTTSSTPSTLQSSMRSSSGMGQTSTSSGADGPSSSSVSGSSAGSNNLLGGLLGNKSLHLRAEPTPAGEGVVPGYMQPAYQPAARPT